MSNLVITTLFTKLRDPQRQVRWAASTDILENLVSSLKGQKLIVLHDELVKPSMENVEFFKVKTEVNPYFQRWMSIVEWLEFTKKSIDKVFCVDGSDVELLRPPWDQMEPGVLYVGDEPIRVNSHWLRTEHRAEVVQAAIRRHKNKPMLNAGLVGGSTADVLAFAQDMSDLYARNQLEIAAGHEQYDLGVGDMGAFQVLAHGKYANMISHGAHVNTEFKAYKDNGAAWWKHK